MSMLFREHKRKNATSKVTPSQFVRLDCKDDPGRTKQEFADDCNINRIIEKFQKTGTVTHLAKHGANYGDIDPLDLHEAMNIVAKANSMFAELPSEVRREFKGDPQMFLEFVQDPANKDDLAEKLPALAKPGNQFPAVDVTTMAAAMAAGEAAVKHLTASASEDRSTDVDGDGSGDT